LKKGRVLAILRQRATAVERAEGVYEWVSHLTAESRYISGIFEDYYIPKDGKLLYYKLTHMKDGLIGVAGLQGVGKTALLKSLAHSLKHSFFLRVKENWQTELEDMNAMRHGIDIESKFDHMPDKTIACYLLNFHYLFIDLPDYSKRNRAGMNKDLKDVENLWKATQEEKGAKHQVLVLGIQKEMFGGHFFFGKMDVVELSPLKPEEMLEAYRKKWATTEPFRPEALLLIGAFKRDFQAFPKIYSALH